MFSYMLHAYVGESDAAPSAACLSMALVAAIKFVKNDNLLFHMCVYC